MDFIGRIFQSAVSSEVTRELEERPNFSYLKERKKKKNPGEKTEGIGETSGQIQNLLDQIVS